MFAHIKELFTRPSGYQISRSVRLRASVSAYLNRTPAGAGNLQKWTWSGWVKRGTLGGTQAVFTAGTSLIGDSGYLDIRLGVDVLIVTTGSTQLRATTAVYRDPSAWYHFVVACDTTQATAANRLFIYVNGVQVTSFTTNVNVTQNTNLAVNNNWQHTFGTYGYSLGSGLYDGYLTEVNLIDGQALTPSSFGETNAVTGVWQAKKYAGTYGTNGFYLNFSDNSAATAAAIGKDYSGNGNNWTPNTISVTAGATYDSMLDVPTPYADGGNGRGNYAVFNPVNVSGGGTTTITDGNLATSVGSTTTYGKILGTIGMTTGKWYWEVLVTAIGGAGNIGIGDGTAPSGSFGLGGVAGELSYQSSGNKYTNNSGTAYGASYTTNDIIGVAYDADAGSITFYKNNTSQGAITGFSGTKYAAVGSGGGTNPQYAINFGQRPFSYTPPTGFVALNTQNLSKPTISNGASYMAATTYTGTGATASISNAVNGVSFQPDFVWIKPRSSASSNILFDSIRGALNYLSSNQNAVEASLAGSLTSFNSNGFSLGTDSNTNGSAVTNVGWQWNAGGSTVTNTSGSISAQVRANATAGFSVVTFTAQTSGTATVGHGLGVAPSMIITKVRNGTSGWTIYHSALSNTKYIVLETTAAAVTLSTVWNNTSPTSTVFTLGSAFAAASQTMVAYCFAAVAGYSAFGSYTGNGSADGPFVFCGFRPRFVMTKRTDSTGDWAVYDTSRDVANVASLELYLNSSSAEVNTARLDILSNGFKLRNVGAFQNANGGTYICMAVAENPFKNSLAR